MMSDEQYENDELTIDGCLDRPPNYVPVDMRVIGCGCRTACLGRSVAEPEASCAAANSAGVW